MTHGKINLLNSFNSEVHVQLTIIISINIALELRFNKTKHSHRKNYGLCTFKKEF